jgi:hypothetical protein
MNDTDLELRRYRSARPLRRELLLFGLALATFILWYFGVTPYSPESLLGLGWGLLVGAFVSYAVRVSRK